MPITKTAEALFQKEASSMKLPEYLRSYLSRGTGKSVLRKGLSGVGKALRTGGKVGLPVAKKINKGISATGNALYNHPRKTLIGGTAAAYGIHNAKDSLSRNLHHVNPNRDITTSSIPYAQAFNTKVTSPIPFRSIQYRSKNLQDRYSRNYNLV